MLLWASNVEFAGGDDSGAAEPLKKVRTPSWHQASTQ